MTKRAILWCGQVRKPVFLRDAEGRLREAGDPTLATDDSKIQANGLQLAFEAARALGVSPGEIHACLVSDDLRPEGLRTAPRRATVPGLQRLIAEISRQATPADALLFIAVNHGAEDGLLTADEVSEFDDDPQVVRLTPAVLDAALGRLAGPQVVVVASCFAGVFLPLGSRAERVVVVACAAGERHFIHLAQCAWSSFLDELFGAWCEVAFSDAIPRARLPLVEAFARAEQRLVAEQAPNRPLRAGSAVWPQ